MKQHIAVKKKMLDLKLFVADYNKTHEPKISFDDFYPIIRDSFHQMYAVGYDQGRQEMCNGAGKMVGQFDEKGIRLIDSFPTVEKASGITGFSTSTIYRSIHKGRPTNAKHLWKYMNNLRPELAERDKGMY